MKKLLLGFIFILVSTVSVPVVAQESLLRIGVLANWGNQVALARWQATANYLSEHIDNTRFEIVPGSFEQLDHAMLNGRIQFVVTNPGHYLLLGRQHPLSWLATMKSKRFDGSTNSIGSAIWVRKDSDIYSLEQLRDRYVVASDPLALGGYMAAKGELKKQGYNADSFFRDIEFLQFPLESLLFAVRDGGADGAITPICTMETMVDRGQLSRSDFRILSTKSSGYSGCAISTDLYPGWSFAASEAVPVELRKQITQLLFNLTADHPASNAAQNSGWTAPASQHDVTRLIEDLYGLNLFDSSLDGILPWLRSNINWVLFFFGFWVFATAYHIWIEYRMRAKSQALIATERSLQQKAIQLERLRGATMIAEIGAGLAHEINQPIGAITNYSQGALRRIEKGQLDVDSHTEMLDKIHKQATRAGAVVHRIRALLKRKSVESVQIDVAQLIGESLELMSLEIIRAQARTEVNVDGTPYPLYGDPIGIQQLLVNLVKNSLDAMAGQSRERKVVLTLHYMPEQVQIEVADSGPGFELSQEESLATFATTKTEGLGLGLAICQQVVKAHDGSLTLSSKPAPDCGGVVLVSLPNRGDGGSQQKTDSM